MHPHLSDTTLYSLFSNIEDLNFNSLKNYSSAILISDVTVYGLYGPFITEKVKKSLNLSVHRILIPSGESSKNIETAQYCWKEMHRLRVDRQALVIGLGGGVITDLAGFVAACYMRGLDVVHIPTTLMGMVDAAIGGKTSVNMESGKNIIGAFHIPKHVYISTYFLQTLPERDMRAGLAEVVKYGIIAEPLLFERLERQDVLNDLEILDTIIAKCCKIKTCIVKQDVKDGGLRAILNFGHTFAHALETATNYTYYLHGEAVAIGMSCAFFMSHVLGLINETLIERLHCLLKKLKLPVDLPRMPPETLLKLMYGDKKTYGGKLNLILVKEIGCVEQVSNVDPQIILKAMNMKLSSQIHGTDDFF